MDYEYVSGREPLTSIRKALDSTASATKSKNKICGRGQGTLDSRSEGLAPVGRRKGTS